MLDRDGTIVAFELYRQMRDSEVRFHAFVDIAQHFGGFAQTPIVE
jgi:hypothetical protein